jgi:hypothetical protein
MNTHQVVILSSEKEIHPGRSGRPNRSRLKANRSRDKTRGVDIVKPEVGNLLSSDVPTASSGN